MSSTPFLHLSQKGSSSGTRSRLKHNFSLSKVDGQANWMKGFSKLVDEELEVKLLAFHQGSVISEESFKNYLLKCHGLSIQTTQDKEGSTEPVHQVYS